MACLNKIIFSIGNKRVTRGRFYNHNLYECALLKTKCDFFVFITNYRFLLIKFVGFFGCVRPPKSLAIIMDEVSEFWDNMDASQPTAQRSTHTQSRLHNLAMCRKI